MVLPLSFKLFMQIAPRMLEILVGIK